ncbi:MAG: hypothetical protein E7Z85_08840 [Methanosphaera stadtmanae]|nr:hypothetical protein [Methanosphaera stadtmanae]
MNIIVPTWKEYILFEVNFKFLKESIGFKHLNRYTFDSMCKATSFFDCSYGISIPYLLMQRKNFKGFLKVNIPEH